VGNSMGLKLARSIDEREKIMTRLFCTLALTAGVAGCVTAQPDNYGYPAYGYGPGYYAPRPQHRCGGRRPQLRRRCRRRLLKSPATGLSTFENRCLAVHAIEARAQRTRISRARLPSNLIANGNGDRLIEPCAVWCRGAGFWSGLVNQGRAARALCRLLPQNAPS
jgi:hypothetical protein